MAMMVTINVGGQLAGTGTSRGRRAGVVLRLGSLVFLGDGLLLLLRTFLGVLGDALVGNPLASFAHVSSQGALLLLLAEGARVLGGFALAGFALSSYRLVLVPVLALLLLLNSTVLRRTVQRTLQRPIGKLFVISIQWIPERSVLDTIAHVVHIHPEWGERFGGGYRNDLGEANVATATCLYTGGNLLGLLNSSSLNEVSYYSEFLPCDESTSYYTGGKCSKNTLG